MKVKGSEVGEWGFKKASDGWHNVMMGEGIDFLKKDGMPIKDDKGNDLYKFPAKINDEAAEDHNVDVSLIIAATPFGERKIADILRAVGEEENFEKAFPGDRSYFENEIFSKVKIKVANKMVKMMTETSKDGKYQNVVKIANISYQPKDDSRKPSNAGAPKAAAQSPASDW